ncbi:MAG: type II secretion system F family protein [Solobacterium sp.]|nr:type II secretion system F family protein [Solobacterium sp.]
MRKRFKKKKTLTVFDCESLYRLLNVGFSPYDTLNLIKDEYNQDIIQEIQNRLNEGDTLKEAMESCYPKEIHTDVVAFSSFLPIEKSLEISLRLKQKKEEAINQSIKILVYPMLLLLGTIGGVFLFNSFVFPTLINLMENFHTNHASYTLMHKTIHVLCILAIVLSILILLIYLYFHFSKHKLRIYLKIQPFLKKTLLQKTITLRFIRYFYSCYQTGIATKETIHLLKNLTQDPIIMWMANELDQQFLQGDSLNEVMRQSYFDATLAKFIHVATNTSSLDAMLERYLLTTEERIRLDLKRFSRQIQVLTYSMIGALLIFIYQILLLPLQALSNI